MIPPAATGTAPAPTGTAPATASNPPATASDSPAGTSDSPAGTSDSPAAESLEAHVSVAEAAALLAIPERTLRDWILTGRVETFLLPHPHPRGKRLKRSVISALQRELAAAGDPPADTSAGPATTSEPRQAPAVEVLTAKLDGAQTAVRLHAERRRTLEGEVSFLRQQLEASQQAERETRLLHAQAIQAQQQTAHELEAIRELVTPKPALPAPRKARWWQPWRRGL